MAESQRRYTLSQLADMVGGELDGPPDLVISRPVPADSDDDTGISFAENEKFLRSALSSGIAAILVPAETAPIPKPCIRVAHPRMAFGIVLAAYERQRELQGIDPTARIHESAQIDPTAAIGPYAVVEADASVGPQCRVMSHAVIGPGCRLGEGCDVFPHAVLVQDVTLGRRCRIHPGAVIGSDGFGYFWNGQAQQKVPQAGGVILGDDVEVGANSCIDRATCGETVIAHGVKIDNLVQIGHNCRIGAHTVMASQVGISGSTVIGERNVFGGQAATSDHVTVGNDMVFGGRSGVMGDMDTPGQYFGTPPVPLSTAMRVLALQGRLPDLYKRMRELEKQIEELKGAAGL